MKINVEKLKEGLVFKNYKHMCQELEMEEKKGTNSRNSHMKDLACYCNYDKEGHKIRIIEVYDEKRDKESGLKGNKNADVYGKYVELLLLDYLIQCNNHVTISKTNLLEKVGLANKNYVGVKGYPKKLATYLGFNVEYVNDFYTVNDNKLKKILKRSLTSLQNQRLIIFDIVHKIKHVNEKDARNANPFEKSAIASIEKGILIQMGHDDMTSVRRSSDWSEFKRKTSQLLKLECGIEYYYEAYDISINTTHIKDIKSQLENNVLKMFNREQCMDELNSKVIDNIQLSSKKKSEDFNNVLNNKEYRFGKVYYDNTMKLTNVLIDRSTNNLVRDILSNKDEYKESNINESLPW